MDAKDEAGGDGDGGEEVGLKPMRPSAAGKLRLCNFNKLEKLDPVRRGLGLGLILSVRFGGCKLGRGSRHGNGL